MKKGWKYRLLCGFFALSVAGTEPLMVFAEGAGAQDTGNNEAVVQDTGTGETGTQESGTPITEEMIDAYFDGSVFVGDSVMMGFRNYAMRKGGPCLGRMQFLSAVSFSVYNALRPVTSKSVHPVYQGQKRLVWESLGMMQAKKVFLFFGLNDIDMGPLESTCARYAQLIANIKTTCPDAEIHIMSMTYTKRGRGKGRLNNPTIRQFNDMLRVMALENGWGFVDIANPLADENGDLAAVYCSDNYVHQTNAAYDVWTAVLRAYAKSQMEGTCPFPVRKDAAPAQTAESTEGIPENAEESTPEETQAAPEESSPEETQAAPEESSPEETQAAPEESSPEETQAAARVIGPKEDNNLTGPGIPQSSSASPDAA